MEWAGGSRLGDGRERGGSGGRGRRRGEYGRVRGRDGAQRTRTRMMLGAPALAGAAGAGLGGQGGWGSSLAGEWGSEAMELETRAAASRGRSRRPSATIAATSQHFRCCARKRAQGPPARRGEAPTRGGAHVVGVSKNGGIPIVPHTGIRLRTCSALMVPSKQLWWCKRGAPADPRP